jgi:5-methylcytosine-specific restriction enzyme B
MVFKNFAEKCKALNSDMDFLYKPISPSIEFSNTGRRGKKNFSISLIAMISVLKDIKANIDRFSPNADYVEGIWRELFSNYITDEAANALSTVQTLPLFSTIGKILYVANNPSDQYSDKVMILKEEYLTTAIEYLESQIPDEALFLPEKNFSASPDEKGENKIFYGAPGTGKSHRIDSLVNAINPDNVIRTVFHSETQQSDFIGCLKPYVKGKRVKYEFQPGPFSEIYKRALNKPGEEFYLVIEEINRAPAAAAFGEVFQLLDRDSNGKGVYDISAVDPMHEQWLENEISGWNKKIRMPGNLTLYATMNSSDQGVFPLDTAFKRRWTFEYIPIDFSNCPKGDVCYYHDGNSEQKLWKEFAEKINKCLAEEGIPEDRHLGPWFVQDSELSQQNGLSPVLTGKVFLYLWDDVLRHGDRATVFHDDIKTYGELVSRYEKKENVFSVDLIGKLN